MDCVAFSVCAFSLMVCHVKQAHGQDTTEVSCPAWLITLLKNKEVGKVTSSNSQSPSTTVEQTGGGTDEAGSVVLLIPKVYWILLFCAISFILIALSVMVCYLRYRSSLNYTILRSQGDHLLPADVETLSRLGISQSVQDSRRSVDSHRKSNFNQNNWNPMSSPHDGDGYARIVPLTQIRQLNVVGKDDSPSSMSRTVELHGGKHIYPNNSLSQH